MNEFPQRLKERKLVQWTVADVAVAFRAPPVIETKPLILPLCLAVGGGFIYPQLTENQFSGNLGA